MSTQLSLDHLDVRDNANLDDFAMPIFTPIINTVQELIGGNVRELYLFGEQGSGKTHLLSSIHQAYQKTYGGQKLSMFLSVKELLGADTQMLVGLEQFSLLLIDDIQLLAGRKDWQEALFHLINRMRSRQNQMIFTASVPVRELDFALLDLITRLSQALAMAMPAGDEVEERLLMIQILLKKRGLRLPDEVIDELAQVGPHHIGDILTVLEFIVPQIHQIKIRGKLSKKMLDDIKSAIIYQSFMTEVADLDIHYDAHNHNKYDDNLSLPI